MTLDTYAGILDSETLKSTLTDLNIGIAWKNMSGIYYDSNDYFAKLLNLKSIKDVIGKNDKNLLWANYATMIASNDKFAIINKKKHISEEKILPVENFLHTLKIVRTPLYNDKENPLGIIYLISDISYQEKIKKHENNNNGHLKAYFDSLIKYLPVNVYWKDINGTILNCNDRLAKTASLFKAEDVIGKTDYDLPWKDFANAIRENDLQILTSKKVIEFEETIPSIKKPGESETFLTIKAPLIADDLINPLGILGISINITDRKKMEEELRAEKEKAEALNEAKRLFILNIQHDIRTPMSGIVPIVEILENTEGVQQNKELYDALKISVARLMDYLNEIIHAGEVVNQGVVIHERKFNLHEIVTSVMEFESAKTEIEKLKLIFHIDNDVPIYVIGDYFALQQTLVSLLSNAIKFTKQGTVQLTVKKMQVTQEKCILRFEIADTGEGIPENKQEAIFELFAKLHCSNTETYKGQGVGLFLVKLYVDKIGGNIDLFSRVGEGTTIRLDLPFTLPLVDDCLNANVLNDQKDRS